MRITLEQQYVHFGGRTPLPPPRFDIFVAEEGAKHVKVVHDGRKQSHAKVKQTVFECLCNLNYKTGCCAHFKFDASAKINRSLFFSVMITKNYFSPE